MCKLILDGTAKFLGDNCVSTLDLTHTLVGFLYVLGFHAFLGGCVKVGNFNHLDHFLVLNIVTCLLPFLNGLYQGMSFDFLVDVHLGNLHQAQVSVDLLLKVVIKS